jgi:hypothetical protein
MYYVFEESFQTVVKDVVRMVVMFMGFTPYSMFGFFLCFGEKYYLHFYDNWIHFSIYLNQI